MDFLRSTPVPAARLRLSEASWFSAFRERAPNTAAVRRLLAGEGMEMEVGFAHGDLGPGNMLEDGGGRFFLFDWENASAQAPVLADPAGFWLACRQREALRVPRRVAAQLRSRFATAPEETLLCALAFLCAHGNLAAIRVLECWE